MALTKIRGNSASKKFGMNLLGGYFGIFFIKQIEKDNKLVIKAFEGMGLEKIVKIMRVPYHDEDYEAQQNKLNNDTQVSM